MMENVNKLVVALTTLAEEATTYLRRENGKEYQPGLPLVPPAASDGPESEVETMTANPAPAPAPKKARKAKAPAAAPAPAPAPVNPETEEQAIADAAAEYSDAKAAEAAIKTEEEQKAAEAKSFERMMEVTKQWVLLAQKDTPKDGKTQAMAWLRSEEFGVEKLGELSHEQRVKWIAKVEKAIQEHK